MKKSKPRTGWDLNLILDNPLARLVAGVRSCCFVLAIAP